MIDKKKTNEAAKAHMKNFEKAVTDMLNGKPYDEVVCSVGGFEAGARWALREIKKSLWHDASEEPEENREFLYQEEDDTCHVMILPGPDWKLCVFLFGVIRWCYIDDLLPEEGGEG